MTGLLKKMWPSYSLFPIVEDFDSLFNILPVKLAQFVKNGDTYEFVMDVNEKATADNVSITLDEGNRNLKIEYDYEFKDETSQKKEYSSFDEALPDDLDISTLDASVENGQLKITAGVLFEPEKKDEDKKKVTIKTK